MNPFSGVRWKRDNFRSSALTPMFWLIAEVTLPCFAAGYYLQGSLIMYVFLFIGCLPLLQAMRSYEFFMKNNPDALRSEKYNIEVMKLGQLGSKDRDLDESAESIKNPELLSSSKHLAKKEL